MSDAQLAKRYWNEQDPPSGKHRSNGRVPVIVSLIEKNGTLIRRPGEARQWTNEHVLVAVWPPDGGETLMGLLLVT